MSQNTEYFGRYGVRQLRWRHIDFENRNWVESVIFLLDFVDIQLYWAHFEFYMRNAKLNIMHVYI